MLINKKFSSGDIVSIKLTSGEELIAKLSEDQDTLYTINKPMVLSMSAQGLGMMPYMITVNPDQAITLLKSAVAAMSSTEKQFADAYVQQTTGIKLV